MKRANKAVRPGIDLPDSLYIPSDSIKGDIDTIVYYSAKDSTVFLVPERKMMLRNKATMNFQKQELDANTIVMDFHTNTLHAMSNSYDSVIASSLAVRRRIIHDSTRVGKRGAPVFKDGATEYEGEVINYNFKSRQGTVELGTSTLEGGFYYGEKIKEVDTKTLFVENGRFTTCTAAVPHYYFESPKMKVLLQDQVFAEPVILYIADVPVFALPFGVFPNHGGGRHSGLIAPGYQTTGDRGYGLTHLGWYQVFDDYFDIASQADIYTKGGYNITAKASYMKRYLLGGAATIDAGYGKTAFSSTDAYQQNWRLGLTVPNLELWYQTSLNASMNLENTQYLQNNAHSLQDLLTQDIHSAASFSTQWEDLGVSLGIDYSRDQQVSNGTYHEESPSIHISKSTFFPFAPSGDDISPDANNNILNTLAISWSTNADRQVARDPLAGDTTGTRFTHTEKIGILHNPSISISPKFSHFTISPSFNYTEAWFVRSHLKSAIGVSPVNTGIGIAPESEQISDQATDEFNRVFNYNMGVGISTTLYGTANLGFLGLKAIRHTLQPSVSFTYRPDLSYQITRNYTDAITKQQVQYNKFDGELNSEIASGGKSGTLGFNLGNDFEMKVERQVNKDSTTDDKVKLLNVQFGTGYDLIQKVWSRVGITGFTQIGSNLSLSGNFGYSLYPAMANSTSDSTAQTLIALKQGILRPISAVFSLSGSFSSKQTTEGDNYDSLRRLVNITTPDDERYMMMGGFYQGAYISVPFRPQWNVGYNMTLNKDYGFGAPAATFSVNMNLTLSPTKNWSFTTGATYDLVGKQIVVPSINVHRDLDCWEMNFQTTPFGAYKYFNLEIRVKAPQLQDIKLTRTESPRAAF